MRRAAAALAVLVAAAGATEAGAQCRQALALGLDVSGSVDQREYRLQLEGLAAALGSEEVRAAIFEGPGHVRIAAYEWSGPRDQRVILPWTDLTDEGALEAALARLRGTERVRAEPTTAIGAAMLTGARMLAGQRDCWQLTLDLSGDGKSNTGPRPGDVGEADLVPGMTVNGLVIGAEAEDTGRERLVLIGEMVAYYNAYVTRGPGSFVEAALGFEDYEAAMRRKLLRELRSLAVGDLGPPERAAAEPPPM